MANYDKIIGGLNKGRSKQKVGIFAASLLLLIVSFAFLGIAENGTTAMTDRRSLLSNTGNNNHNSINADSAARTREMKGVNGKSGTSSTSSAKTQNIHNIQNKQHVAAGHEWKAFRRKCRN